MSEITQNPAHIQWLHSRAHQLTEAILASWNGSFRLECSDSLEESIFQALSEVGKQTLDVLYYGGDLKSDAEIRSNGDILVEQACPQLIALLMQEEARLSSVIPQILGRMDQHSGEIAQAFLHVSCFDRMLGFDFGAGDSHNHGQTVVIVTTEAGIFVYKPHSLAADIVLRQISVQFFPDIFHVPPVLDYGDFGFCAYAENKPVTNAEEAKRYYRRMGGFCAVSRILGSTDLHLENMLCYHGFPTPIDCEAVFTPDYTDDSPFRITNYINHTLLNSCLMPSWFNNRDHSFLFSQSKDNVSVPVIDGQRHTMDKYLEDFQAGFRQAYQQALAQQDALLNYVHSLQRFPVRVIIMSTRIYGRILQRSRMWKWVTMPDRPSAMQQELLEQVEDEKRRHLLQTELDALLEGDIPYFYAPVDSKDLYSADGMITSDYLAMSARERAEIIIRNLSEEDMNFHCQMFRLATGMAVRFRRENVTDITTWHQLTDEDCLTRAEALARDILDEIISIPTGDLICFYRCIENDNSMSVARTDIMNDVNGIGIFLAAMLKNTQDSNLKEKLKDTLNDILHSMRSELDIWMNTDDDSYRDSSYGMSCGLTGILMAANLIHRYTGIEMCRQMCRDILTYFTQYDPMPKNPDIISGPAALLKLLCLNRELREYPGAEAVMHKAADQLLAMRQESPRLWLTIDKKRYLSGAAHGQSGIGTALALAGNLLKRPDLAEAADDALHYEAKLYSSKLKGWPDLRRIALPDSSMHGYCSGAPGIGMNALQRGTEDPYGLLPLAIDSCLHHNLLPLDHFCCGNSAAVDFLLEAGRKLNDHSLIIKSRDILSAFSDRADQNGGYQFSDKNHRPVGAPALFFGNAGVGYVLLRQIDEDLVTLML